MDAGLRVVPIGGVDLRAVSIEGFGLEAVSIEGFGLRAASTWGFALRQYQPGVFWLGTVATRVVLAWGSSNQGRFGLGQ